MRKRLPTITRNGVRYYVDFRLEELRTVKTAKPIKFTSLKEGKNSKLKKKLRAIRFNTWRHEYIAGIDD